MIVLQKEMRREQAASAGRRAEALLKEIDPYLKAMQQEVLQALSQQRAAPLSAWALSCLQARAQIIRELEDRIKRDINAGRIAEREDEL